MVTARTMTLESTTCITDLIDAFRTSGLDGITNVTDTEFGGIDRWNGKKNAVANLPTNRHLYCPAMSTKRE